MLDSAHALSQARKDEGREMGKMQAWVRAADIRVTERNMTGKNPRSASQAREWSIWWAEAALTCSVIAMGMDCVTLGPQDCALASIGLSAQALRMDQEAETERAMADLAEDWFQERVANARNAS